MGSIREDNRLGLCLCFLDSSQFVRVCSDQSKWSLNVVTWLNIDSAVEAVVNLAPVVSMVEETPILVGIPLVQKRISWLDRAL
jgi:hypothetical protein